MQTSSSTMDYSKWNSIASVLQRKAPNDHFILSVIGSTRCKTPTDRDECASILLVANRELLQLLRTLSLSLSLRVTSGTAADMRLVRLKQRPNHHCEMILSTYYHDPRHSRFFCGASKPAPHARWTKRSNVFQIHPFAGVH
jgi:hypothetical protein